MQKLTNPETQVPKHEAFKPVKPQYEKAREYERNKKIEEIENENSHIMKKLVNINRRKMDASKSSPNLALPKIKKEFNIPNYEEQNNLIARKIIESKPRIANIQDTKRYHSIEAQKKNISKYHNQDGMVINRKKYLAGLMLLKKMRVSELLQQK